MKVTVLVNGDLHRGVITEGGGLPPPDGPAKAKIVIRISVNASARGSLAAPLPSPRKGERRSGRSR